MSPRVTAGAEERVRGKGSGGECAILGVPSEASVLEGGASGKREARAWRQERAVQSGGPGCDLAAVAEKGDGAWGVSVEEE